MKHFFRNRTVIGITCILAALLFFFGIGPVVLSHVTQQVWVTRVKKEIPANTQIKESMLETVKIGGYNMPTGVITKESDIVNQYSTIKMEPGDYIFSSKISALPSGTDAYLAKLDGTKVATSVSVKSLDDSLSGKLQPGDIISLDIADYGEMKQTVLPPELQYVLLIGTITDSGTESDQTAIEKSNGQNNSGSSKDNLPSTLMVLVTPEQKKSLVDYNKNGSVHASLVYRGTRDNAQKFLDLEEQFLLKEKAGDSSAGSK